MGRPAEVVRAEIVKVERELGTLRNRVMREAAEQNVGAFLAGLRGQVAAQLPPPEAIVSGGATVSRDAGIMLGAYLALASPAARELLTDYCGQVLRSAPSAKDTAKAISGLEGRLERLRREERESELAELRADLEGRSALIEAEEIASRNAAVRSAA